MVEPKSQQSVILYPGCLILARFPDYERAAAEVLTDLGFEVRSPEGFCCCGATLLPGISSRWLHLASYTLALAAKHGAWLVTLCGNCFHNFQRARKTLIESESERRSVARALAALGLPFPDDLELRHLIHLLSSEARALRSRVARAFSGRVAITYPCQVFRPLPLAEADEVSTLSTIVEALGCEVVDYSAQYDCCGATALLYDRNFALRQGQKKLQQATAEGADLLVAGCGNCLLLLERHRPEMQLQGKSASLAACSVAELAAWTIGHPVHKLDQVTGCHT